MNPNENSELSVQTLLALRQESDALRVIAEKLRVKEMGPAYPIRTKPEVKAFVESGDTKAAETLMQEATERTAATQAVANRVSQTRQRSQGLGQQEL